MFISLQSVADATSMSSVIVLSRAAQLVSGPLGLLPPRRADGRILDAAKCPFVHHWSTGLSRPGASQSPFPPPPPPPHRQRRVRCPVTAARGVALLSSSDAQVRRAGVTGQNDPLPMPPRDKTAPEKLQSVNL